MRMSNTNQAVTKQPLLIAPNHHHHHHHHHLSPDADGDGDSYINMSTTNKYKYINNSLALLASASSPCNPKMKNFKYMECLKNHAAAIGGSATDGCGEFMPGGEEGSLEALKCEACNCHRNFHRKKIIPHYQPQPQPQPQQLQMGMGMGMGMRMKSISTSGEGRKRPRSKFSQEQKEKMQRFAEKAEWKIHKADDAELRSFCEEIGVNAKVLKVWMHNNKYNHHIPTNPNSNPNLN